MWCWIYSDHQVLFYWRDSWRLQNWHCLYGENMCSMYILTVMAPLFVNSINWLHWSIYHRSVICLFQVLSKGVIVHHGYEKVEVKSSNGAASGTVLFKLSVGADLAPAVQILAYCVLPSENVAAGSTKFDVEKCFSNKVRIVSWEISLLKLCLWLSLKINNMYSRHRCLCSFLLLKQFLVRKTLSSSQLSLVHCAASVL